MYISEGSMRHAVVLRRHLKSAKAGACNWRLLIALHHPGRHGGGRSSQVLLYIQPTPGMHHHRSRSTGKQNHINANFLVAFCSRACACAHCV